MSQPFPGTGNQIETPADRVPFLDADGNVIGWADCIRHDAGGNLLAEIHVTKDFSFAVPKDAVIERVELQAYGGTADLWGMNLTPDDINSSGFGVVISPAAPQPDHTVDAD